MRINIIVHTLIHLYAVCAPARGTKGALTVSVTTCCNSNVVTVRLPEGMTASEISQRHVG